MIPNLILMPLRRGDRQEGRMSALSHAERMELFEEHRAYYERYAVAFTFRRRDSGQAEDIQNEALVGLWEATERFDPGRGVKFRTFAAPIVRGRMLDWVREHGAYTRTGRLRRPVFHLESVAARLSLAARWHNDRAASTALDLLLMDHRHDDSLDRDAFDELTKVVPGKVREWLWWYYHDGLSMREIGEREGYAESRVSQVFRQCREWISEQLAAHAA